MEKIEKKELPKATLDLMAERNAFLENNNKQLQQTAPEPPVTKGQVVGYRHWYQNYDGDDNYLTCRVESINWAPLSHNNYGGWSIRLRELRKDGKPKANRHPFYVRDKGKIFKQWK